MSHAHWSPDDRDEYDALVDEVLVATDDSTDRAALFLRKLRDAEQAQRFWASDVLREIEHDGSRKRIVDEAKRRVPRVAVSYEGVSLGTVHRTIGTRTRTDIGKTAYVQTLFDYPTFDALREKRLQHQADIAGHRRDIAALDRLLELEGRAPGTTPAEVCRALGITVEEWLAGAAA